MATDRTFGPEGWTPERLGSLEGKTYLITGANSGTGFEATRTFLSKGASVVMLNRSAERSDAAIGKLTDESQLARVAKSFTALDLGLSWDPNFCNSILRKVKDRFVLEDIAANAGFEKMQRAALGRLKKLGST